MARAAKQTASDLCAVVTGANKGIGLATVRLLAQQGVTVVLTGRNEKLGLDAVESLSREFGLSNVIFHQLDVRDSVSVANLAQFIAARFGKLDILVKITQINFVFAASIYYWYASGQTGEQRWIQWTSCRWTTTEGTQYRSRNLGMISCLSMIKWIVWIFMV